MAGRKIGRPRRNTDATIIDAGRIVDILPRNDGDAGSVPIGDGGEIFAHNESAPGDSGTGYVNPADARTGDGGDSGTGKRRGRPRGTAGRRNKSTSETSANLEALLFSLHAMAASFTSIPELMLTQDEAKLLADATKRVSDLYEISVIPEKAMAWINLCIVAGGIYGPRYMVAMHKEKTAPATNIETFPTYTSGTA